MNLARSDEQRLRAIVAELKVLSLDHPFAMPALVEPLRELLRSEVGMAYNFRSDLSEVSLDALELACDASSRSQIEREFPPWVRVRGVDFTAYNPLRPPPEHRNRSVAIRQMVSRRRMDGQHPFFTQLLPRIGFQGHDQARVLICEGASHLAWVGALREEDYTRRELEILRRLTPHLKRRLITERELRGPSSRRVLESVLDAIGAPAFIISGSGAIDHANALGRELHGRSRTEIRDRIRTAMRGGDSQVELTPLRAVGLAGVLLAVVRRVDPGAEPRVAAACMQWRATPRQAQTLTLLVQGLTNKTIAAELGCSDRTIEAHVAALLEKAQVESRAALIARVLRASC